MSSNALYTAMTPVAFFTMFPVTNVGPRNAAPPVAATGFTDKAKQKMGLQAVPAPPNPYIKGNSQAAQGIVDGQRRVGVATFSQDTGAFGQLISLNCKHPTRMSIAMGDPTLPGIPVFYLPYQDNENYRLTLVDKQGLGAALCTTALVDGCSVYVEGTQAAPTIYHINAAGTQAPAVPLGSPPDAQRLANWAAKYAHMDTRFRGDATKVGPNLPRVQLPKSLRQMDVNLILPGKLENHDYMIVPGQIAAFEATLPALQVAGKARTAVGGVTVDEMMLISTQGTVFGVMTAGLWRMYVQRRALVQYFHIVGPGTANVSLGLQWIVRDVMEFWPAANVGTQFASIW